MIRVMIADDEQYEREYLQKILKERYAGRLDVVYMAKDGAEVLEAVEECRPEIILMDIRMPRLDGLEAAAQLLRKYPRLQLIIVSAYGEFSYAKQAMKLGVRDFLVKPYLDEELVETVDRAIASIARSESNDFEDADDSTFDFYEDMDKDIVWELVQSQKKDETLTKALAFRGVETSHFKCIVFFHDSILDMGNTGCNIVKGMFYFEHAHALVSYLLNQLVVYVFTEDETVFGEINACIRKTRTYLKELGHTTVFCGVSGIYDRVSDGRTAYMEAAEYILEYTDENTRNECRTIQDASFRLREIEDKVCFYLMNKNEEQSMNWCGQLIDLFWTHGKPEYAYGKQHFRRCLLTILRRLNRIPEQRLKTSEAVELFHMFGEQGKQKEDLLSLAENVVSRLALNWKNTPSNNNALVVRRAREYLAEHYSDCSISLLSVAEQLGISSGYLSKCFKNVEGIAFTEYLTSVRMERAKERMREQKGTISEISWEVGFSDPNYFGKCFKKYEKISPKEYYAMYAD